MLKLLSLILISIISFTISQDSINDLRIHFNLPLTNPNDKLFPKTSMAYVTPW